jgi:hypothetical protein
MEFMYVALAAEVVFLGLMGFVLWKLLAALKRRAGGLATTGASGGWSALESVWAHPEPPKNPVSGRASLMVGKVLWRNCVVVGVDPAGLHLAVRAPVFGGFGKSPVRIPWGAFRDPEPARLFWGAAHLWHLGTPDVATITLPADLEAKIAAKGGRLGG